MAVNIQLFGTLDDVAADAGGALDRTSRASLYERLDWFRLIEAYCPPPGELLAVRSESDCRQGWLFLVREGARASAYANWYSLRAGPIGDGGVDVMTSFGIALRDQGVGSLSLAPLENPEPLAAGLREAGWIVDIAPDKANWRIETEGIDFDAYWAFRPGTLRNTVKRKTKAANLEISIHTAFSEAAWADYKAVYLASWKPEEGSFPFLRALAEEESAASNLRLGIAKQDGVPVAAQLWLVEQGEATIHKLAYAESAKALSPGSILGQAMFRHALDVDRVSVIDYGLGDEPYKADWMAERRMLWRLTAHDPRQLRGLAGAIGMKAAALARRLRSG